MQEVGVDVQTYARYVGDAVGYPQTHSVAGLFYCRNLRGGRVALVGGKSFRKIEDIECGAYIIGETAVGATLPKGVEIPSECALADGRRYLGMARGGVFSLFFCETAVYKAPWLLEGEEIHVGGNREASGGTEFYD